MSQSILIIAAHPDDEVLGCGGTIARYTARGVQARAIFLAYGITARDGMDSDELQRRQSAGNGGE